MMKSHSEWNEMIVPRETSFATLYEMQMKNQDTMFEKGLYKGFTEEDEGTYILPKDDVRLMSYHIMQLMSEIGELLDSDKRWKNFRADKFEKDEKLKELADCFIVLMNVTMFSGFSAGEIVQAIADKIVEVKRRMG